MSDHNIPEFSALESAFDEHWREFVDGRRPSPPELKDFLASSEAANREQLLRSLLGIELDYRAQSNGCPAIDEYLQRFPGDEGLIRRVWNEWEATNHESIRRKLT